MHIGGNRLRYLCLWQDRKVWLSDIGLEVKGRKLSDQKAYLQAMCIEGTNRALQICHSFPLGTVVFWYYIYFCLYTFYIVMFMQSFNKIQLF